MVALGRPRPRRNQMCLSTGRGGGGAWLLMGGMRPCWWPVKRLTLPEGPGREQLGRWRRGRWETGTRRRRRPHLASTETEQCLPHSRVLPENERTKGGKGKKKKRNAPAGPLSKDDGHGRPPARGFSPRCHRRRSAFCVGRYGGVCLACLERANDHGPHFQINTHTQNPPQPSPGHRHRLPAGWRRSRRLAAHLQLPHR